MNTPAATSLANSDTKGKKVYKGTPMRIPTCIGETQPQGDPGGVFVNGSGQVRYPQSTNSMNRL